LKIILHICCGVCAAATAKTLQAEGHEVTGFFYNPNIYPEEEFERRLETTCKVARALAFPLESMPYAPESWFKETDALKQEPEGGKRCEVCYQIRLQKTYEYLTNHKADAFATTLTISPHKSAMMVNRIGKEIGGDRFLSRDFKKKDGFKQTMQLARSWELYRQDYCGCIYSIKHRTKDM